MIDPENEYATWLFVDLDPHFFLWPDEAPGEDGLVWLHDAEGANILRCHPAMAVVIGMALEYALADVESIYGCGFGLLDNSQVALLLHRHLGQHPHVGASSVAIG